MEANEKCVRSYLPHALLYRGIAGKPFAKPILIPVGSDEKPYVVVSDADLVLLMEETSFKSALEQFKLKILPAIPSQFQDLATTLVQLRSANGEFKNRILALETENADLKTKLADVVENVSKKLDEQDKALSPEALADIKTRIASAKAQ